MKYKKRLAGLVLTMTFLVLPAALNCCVVRERPHIGAAVEDEAGTEALAGAEIEAGPHRVLYHYDGVVLRDSKWGKLAEFQRGLQRAWSECRGEERTLTFDGAFGPRTNRALADYLACRMEKDAELADSRFTPGVVDAGVWTMILPRSPLPDAHERAFALCLTHEGTDYDRAEWNYGTIDDRSALTWGPYGATAGWGNEIRAVLEIINGERPGLMRAAFGREYSTALDYINSPPSQGHRTLQPVYRDVDRRRAFQNALAELGSHRFVRQAYDSYALDSGYWLAPPMRLLYGLLPNARQEATEIDYAFFLDLSMHASVSGERAADCRQAIRWREEQEGREITPAERRQVIGEVFAEAVRLHRDRRGRNVVFYIDGLGEEALSEEERRAWQNRSRLRASCFGLSDDAAFCPELLCGGTLADLQ